MFLRKDCLETALTSSSSPITDDFDLTLSESRSHIMTAEKKTLSPQQAAENIKDAARRIRETSSAMRDMVRTIHESGAIEELAAAIPEASIASRDTARGINETAKDLKERGIIRDEATAL